eukprot:gene25824-biopygen13559
MKQHPNVVSTLRCRKTGTDLAAQPVFQTAVSVTVQEGWCRWTGAALAGNAGAFGASVGRPRAGGWRGQGWGKLLIL